MWKIDFGTKTYSDYSSYIILLIMDRALNFMESLRSSCFGIDEPVWIKAHMQMR